MQKAEIHVDKHFQVGEVDQKIFGSFIEHLGRAVYGGIYQPNSPLSNDHGFRIDVLKLVKALNVPVIRYPGGNFVSGYFWEDSVGPKEQRKARLDLAWTELETNQFGLNEFMQWAQEASVDVMMAINLGTRGIEDAKNLLEYCNFTRGTYYSDLRIKHGYQDPYGIKLWCLGNEMDGLWQIGHKTAYEYARLAAKTGRVMKMMCPEIELVACGSSNWEMPTFGDWESTVLRECYDIVDYVSLHQYYDIKNDDTSDFLACSTAMDRFINQVISICDAEQARLHKKKVINLSFDEWNVWHGINTENKELDPWSESPHHLENEYDLRDALLVGSMLITLLRHADRVRIACLAQLVNVIAPIMTSDSSSWKQTIYYPYLFTSLYGRGIILNTIIDSPTIYSKKFGDVPVLDAVWVEGDGDLTLFAVNKDLSEDIMINCDLRQYKTMKVVEHIVLTNEDIRSVNTESFPERVTPSKSEESRLEDGVLRTKLVRHSWNMIRLEEGKN